MRLIMINNAFFHNYSFLISYSKLKIMGNLEIGTFGKTERKMAAG